MSILSEIQSRKKSRKTVVFGTVFGIVVVMIIVYIGYSVSENGENISYKIHTVSSGSIAETVSGDGKMLHRGYYTLSAPTAGRIAVVYKKEGDKIGKDEPIISLDDTYLRLHLEKAEIALQNARANLIAKEASAPSSEEIRIAEEQLKQARIALENTKRQADSDVLNAEKSLETALVSLRSAESDLMAIRSDTDLSIQNTWNSVSITEKELRNAENDLQRTMSDGSGSLQNLREKGFLAIESMANTLAKNLEDMDNLLGVSDANRSKNDAFEAYLGAKNSTTKSRAEGSFHAAKSGFDTFMSDWNRVRINPPYTETLLWMDRIHSVSVLVSDSLSQTIAMLRNSISSSIFPETSIDASVTLFDSALSSLHSQNSLFVTDRQAITIQETNLSTEEKARRDAISILYSRWELAKGELVKAESNARILLLSSEYKLDLAKKQVESNEITHTATVNRWKDAVTVASQQVDIARATLEAKKKRISPEETAPYHIAIRSAQNAVKEARQQLFDAVLRSPIDGMIAKIDAQIGEEAILWSPLVSLIDTGHPYIESAMEEIDIAKIRLGQSVRIGFDALEGITFTGSVIFISPSSAIDANGIVTYRVEIAFEPGTAIVREGMTATVEYIVHEASNVLVVPTNFLSETDGKYSIFSLDRNMNIPVEIGISDGKMAEVNSGVSFSEKIRSE